MERSRKADRTATPDSMGAIRSIIQSQTAHREASAEVTDCQVSLKVPPIAKVIRQATFR